jgi:hypothetical protein
MNYASEAEKKWEKYYSRIYIWSLLSALRLFINNIGFFNPMHSHSLNAGHCYIAKKAKQRDYTRPNKETKETKSFPSDLRTKPEQTQSHI